MRIDRKARPWYGVCLLLLVAAIGLFVPYYRHTGGHPTGGSGPGLGYGAAGSACMLIAMFLAVRKQTRSVRLGRTQYWMQAHVWFGLLSYPLILLHGGFAWGGVLTQVIMYMFTFVFISGIIGIVLQHFMPKRILREVPDETIADQVDHVLAIIRQEADTIMHRARGKQEADLLSIGAGGARDGGTATLERPVMAESTDPFDAFYLSKILPFLADSFDRESPLAGEVSAREAFRQWRSRLPEELISTANRLESLVEERRQLNRQKRFQSGLHLWLLVHVPLSYGLLILGTIHAIMAFKFTSHG